MAQETTHAARLVLDRQVFDLHVRVRHSQEQTPASGVGAAETRVGLEFIGLSPAGRAEIDRYLGS